MKKIFLMILLTCFIYNSIQAQCDCVRGRNYTWTNFSGDNNWGNPANWTYDTRFPYDTCGFQNFVPRYCDNVSFENAGHSITVIIAAGLTIGLGSRQVGSSECKSLTITNASVYFTGGQGFTVSGISGGLSLVGTSEIRTFYNGFISGTINIGGGFHPLPGRFAALTMDADCGIYTGVLNLAGEMDITRCKLDALNAINLGSTNSDIEVKINSSNLYGDLSSDTGKVTLVATNIYPRNSIWLPGGLVSYNCNVIFDTLVSSNSPYIYIGEGRAFGGNIYSNKKNADFNLLLQGPGNGLRYINGELKIDAGTLNITCPYQFDKVTTSPFVNVNVKSNIVIK